MLDIDGRVYSGRDRNKSSLRTYLIDQNFVGLLHLIMQSLLGRTWTLEKKETTETGRDPKS